MDAATRFGDNLVRCRKLADLSQDELSVRASVHRTEISQLERGPCIARIDTLAKLCGVSKSSWVLPEGRLEARRHPAWPPQGGG